MLSDVRSKEIARLRFRVGAVLVLRECLRLFFAWFMIWAMVAIGLRAVFRMDPFVLLWGALGLIVAIGIGMWLAVRKIPSSAAIRAVLDRHGRLGGLLMAAGDTDIGGWHPQIERVPMPPLRWRFGRQWMLLTASMGFLAAALMAPDRLSIGSETTLQIGGEIQKLTEKLQVLKQEQIVPPEKAQVLERDFNDIRQEASGEDPAKTMEAIDHLEQSFSKAAAEAAQSAIKQMETSSRTQELAAALGSAEGQMDSKQFGEAMKELARMAEQAAAENSLLAENLSAELQNALQQGVLTDQQLRELCKAFKKCKACQRAKLAKLVKAKLLDADKLTLCDKAGECDGAALAHALCCCKDGSQLAECLACCGSPGRGGVSRGRGDAVMTWQTGVKKEDAAFKEKVLPPAAVASLQKSRLASISVGDPTSAKPGGGSVGGALRSAQSGSGEARAQIIFPEHEKTVQRYFSREKK